MKRLLALALVCGVATTTQARPPMLAPLNDSPVNYQAQYSPQPIPTPVTALPPAPGTIPGDQRSLPPGTYVTPDHPITQPQQPIQPQPMTVEPGVIIGDVASAPYLPLYPRVRVVQARKIAPCAVQKIVSVPDPCNPCQCVFVSICVPPCACENVTCHPRKNRTKFDYGKYAVKITERRGTLVINYDD